MIGYEGLYVSSHFKIAPCSIFSVSRDKTTSPSMLARKLRAAFHFLASID
jgi:hypothetical protein